MRENNKNTARMWRKRLRIGGMHCEDCARKIEKLSHLKQGLRLEVSFAKGLGVFSGYDESDFEWAVRNIESMGFKVETSEPSGPRIREKPEQALHIAIIGSGSAAFACAIRAVESGARVTMIERSPIIGGTCVNVGCIPSKILVRAAGLAHLIKQPAYRGIRSSGAPVDFKSLSAMQREQVDTLREAKYEQILEGQPNIQLLQGQARFLDRQTMGLVQADDKEIRVNADRFLIATGSFPIIPPIPGLAATPYWTSTEALSTQKLPSHLIVIGSGIIALELSQAFLRLGSRVTLVVRHRLLRNDDEAIGREIHSILESEGMRIVTKAQAQSIRFVKRRIRSSEFVVDLGNEVIRGDRLLIATGRQANTRSLNLEKAGIRVDEAAIQVDDRLRTSNPQIYAAGDCTNMPHFVYVAAAAGTRAAVNMTGGDERLDISLVPKVIFTDPQVATVGLSEAEASSRYIRTESSCLGLENVPRAFVNGNPRGFIKLVAKADGGELIGAQIVAPSAGEMIQTATLAIRNRLTVFDLASQLFPYLTMVEGIKLCAQSFTKDVRQLSCCAG